jgi:hypothetical protein
MLIRIRILPFSFDTAPDPDPTFQFDADPDPDFEPPAFQFAADPIQVFASMRIRIQLPKMMRILTATRLPVQFTRTWLFVALWLYKLSASGGKILSVLGILDVYPGSECFPSRIRIFRKYFNPKKWFPSSRKYDPS